MDLHGKGIWLIVLQAFAMLRRSRDALPSEWKYVFHLLSVCHASENEFRKELVHMLFHRRKAEIEILSTVNTTDVDLLEREQEYDASMGMDMHMVVDLATRSSTADVMISIPRPVTKVMSTENDNQQSHQERGIAVQSHEGFGMPLSALQLPSPELIVLSVNTHSMFWNCCAEF